MAGRSTVRVTFDSDAGFLVWCEDCNEGWPLTLECWNPRRGLTRCAACWRERSAAWIANRRLDPEFRGAELEANRASYYARNRKDAAARARGRYHAKKALADPIRLADGLHGDDRRRAYNAAWMRRKRAAA